MSVSMRKGFLWFAATGGAVLLVGLLLAVPDDPTPENGAALRVQVDPETGEIVPVTGLDKAELDRQMRQSLNRSTSGLREVRQDDGGVTVDLAGRFQSLSVATTDSTGQVQTHCVTNGRGCDDAMHGAGAANAAHGERE